MPILDLADRCRYLGEGPFSLANFDPGHTGDLDKKSAQPLLVAGVEKLTDLQERLYAQHQWAPLFLLQGMDTSGKDGVVKHVMSGVNPLGCQAHSFQAPSRQELDHDYLWRSNIALPRRGHIGIFNRSYYEEVLVVRVHRHMLEAQNLPKPLVNPDIWTQRFYQIRVHERYLRQNGVLPIKVFLHLSKDEQRKRLLARIEDEGKQWKFSASDIADRENWDVYHAAYEDMIFNTATQDAPWYIVPADHKWFARLTVAAIMIKTLDALDPQPCRLDEAERGELEKARNRLLSERDRH